MPDRVSWAFLLLGVLVSLAVCYSIANGSLILGSPAGGWHYGYVRRFSVRAVGAALLVTGACGALLFAEPWRRGRFEWAAVLVWILAATALQGILRSLTPVPLEAIFLSDGANSFYSVTQHYDAGTVLENFQQVRANSPLHAQSNMPGKLMLLYGLQAITTRTDLLPWLLILVSNLGGALMYIFVRDLFESRQVALFSLVLYLFVPAKLFFFPLMNTITPAVFFGCACLLLKWLRTGKTVFAALFGVALYGLAFFEPLPLVMGVLFAALIARAVRAGEVTGSRLASQLAAGAFAFAATYAAVRLWFGFDLIGTFQQVGAHAVEFNTTAGRPYSVWVRENLREFAFGAGICQVVLFWPALVGGFSGPGSWRSHFSKPIVLLCLSLLTIVAVTDLLGINRGEVIRLWIFLACLVQVPAAYLCARLESPTALAVILVATTLQSALGTAMIGFVVLG